MPTKKQLHKIWKTEFALFGGDPKINGYPEPKNVPLNEVDMSNVNRSVYQKVVEENKRLIADIKLLVDPDAPSGEKINCLQKWSDRIREQKEFNRMLQEAARKYIKEHADELPDFLTES